MTYTEKLRHPLWQKRRLEIMDRDGFACLDCGSSDKTLNVHHCYYESGLMPWEYPDEALKTLCEDCHKNRQSIELWIQRHMSKFTTSELERLNRSAFFAIYISGLNHVESLILNDLYPDKEDV